MKLLVFLCFAADAIRFRRSGDFKWGYADNGAHWGDHVETCAKERQSPVDIPTKTAEESTASDSFNLENYDKEVSWTGSNNGHAVQLTLGEGEKLKVSGGFLDGAYELAQFHFHWGSKTAGGSEHTSAGHHHFAEIHLVHFKEEYGSLGGSVDKGDGLAVLGFFVDAATDHVENELDTLIQTTIGNKLKNATAETPIDKFAMGSIMPKKLDNYYRYLGSLTTPGCNEAVVWTVFKDSLKISEKTRDAMATFAHTANHETLDLNYRVVQPLNGRTITYYSSTVTESKAMPEAESEDSHGANTEGASGHNWMVFVIGLLVVVVISLVVVCMCRKNKEPEYAAGQA